MTGPAISSQPRRKIPLFKPNLGEEELSALREIFSSGWVGLGPKTAEFEAEMAKYQNRHYAIGMNSCTAALHLAIEALELPPDSEVLVPTITFVSTPHAVHYNGLKVRFVDVRRDDLCMDVSDFESKITPRTKAVIPVHMGGQPCRMDEIMKVAKQAGLWVIEDVANAQGGAWKGKKLGSWGDFGTFSFEAKKNMTTGDGGMLVFDEEKPLAHLRQMRWVGIDKDTWKRFSSSDKSVPWRYDVHCLGYKYNMNDVAATIGLCQLKKLDRINEQKRSLISRYLQELKGVGDLQLPPYDLKEGGYWLFIIQTPQRDALIEYLGEKGVTTGVHFMPTHLHPYYRQHYPDTRLPVSEQVWQTIVTLPLYATMTPEDQSYVIDMVKAFFPVSVLKMNFETASTAVAAILDEYIQDHRKPFVPGKTLVQYAGNVFGVEEYKAAADILLKGWLGLASCGQRLEQEIFPLLGQGAGVLTNSGSSANLLALATACSPNFRNPLKPGDEVITTASSFPTTLNPILQHRLVPVFIDVELGDYNLMEERLEDAVSPKTRALMFAHTLGNPADMDVITRFCSKHKLLLIEDCCDALGGTFKGKPVGSFGDFATLSMYPSHHMTIGEGGFVACRSEADHQILRALRDWGRACYCVGQGALLENGTCGTRFSKWLEGVDEIIDHKYVYSEIGYNLRPIEIQAAIGLEQVKRLPQFIETRRQNFKRYHGFFKTYEQFFQLPVWNEHANPSWFAFAMSVKDSAPFKKHVFVKHLEDHKIQTRNLFAGNILRHPAYRDIQHRVVGTLTNSDQIIKSTFFIGVYPGITKEMTDYVCQVAGDFLRKYTK